MSGLSAWVEAVTGHRPRDEALFRRALTHSSRPGEADYERLEFLGDRVLGLSMARWLYEIHPREQEGKLSHRLNVLVSREACAGIARDIGAASHLRLGKQAYEDGASESDNVLGDIIESLLGALFLEAGLEVAEAFVRRHWEGLIEDQGAAPKHPKSALQEWAAANQRKSPDYRLVETSGPSHAPRFIVEVSIRNVGDAQAEGASKQEAETEAARQLLEKLA